MANSEPEFFYAFTDTYCVAQGDLAEVVARAKSYLDAHPQASLLVFDERCERVEINFQGTPAQVQKRVPLVERERAAAAEPVAAPTGPRGRGRPKLGVVAHEVTLLPRHWEWLNSQPGGASVTLRKLVELARRDNQGKDRVRQAQEVAYRFILAMAGDRVGFEEATRALFAGDKPRFLEQTSTWPADIQCHALHVGQAAFAPPTETP